VIHGAADVRTRCGGRLLRAPTRQPVGSADDLARDGVFDGGEIDEFLIDLYAMRRSNLA